MNKTIDSSSGGEGRENVHNEGKGKHRLKPVHEEEEKSDGSNVREGIVKSSDVVEHERQGILSPSPLPPPPSPSPSRQQQQHRNEAETPPNRLRVDNSLQSILLTTREMFHFNIMLENKGSVARDHMANERTFLSWIRTAMTLVTFAIGFLQIYRLDIKSNQNVIDETTGQEYDIGDKTNKTYQALAKPISTLCVLLGMLGCIFGLVRYFQVQFLLIRNYYPATRLFIIILIIINLAMLILLLLLDIKLTI